MNGNKKIAKKIVAGSMAVMMAAGLAGTYEYHSNAMQVQAAEQKDKDTQELKETAENVLADHATDSEDTGFSKEESVYVKADASGNVKKTTVSEWLKNPEKGGIPDMARQATRKVRCVKGIYLRRPPMRLISLLPMVWMMAPAQRKSRALNMACVKRWNIEAI